MSRPSLLELLPGVWEGPGDGHYPTIEPFGYREQLSLWRLGDKPVVAYAQQTWHGRTGDGLHRECGYLRVDGDRVELVVAQPTGFAEVHHGVYDGTAIDFGITAFGRTASALRVQTLRRRWEISGDRLVTELWMSYAGVVDAHHLRSELHRTPPTPH